MGAPTDEGGRERERSAGSSVCVSQALWLSTGAAWHPQECGFSRLPRPPPVPQGGGRQEKKGGKRAEICLTQHELQTKTNLSDLLQEGPGGGQGTKEPHRLCRQAPDLLGFVRRSENRVEAWEYGGGW